jgi:Protein of unknown function (DUF2628)
MAVYTVHEPPQRDADLLAHTGRFVFIRDGFSWGAFLLAPLWMLRHKLWLALVGYLALAGAVGAILWLVGASANTAITVAILLSALIGFEASSLRRWALERRGWADRGVVVAEDEESAERRFFAEWVIDAPSRLPTPTRSAVAPRAFANGSSDVIGLFPEPGAPR